MDKKNGWILPGQIARSGIPMQKGIDSVDGQPLCRCRPCDAPRRLDGLRTATPTSRAVLRAIFFVGNGVS